MGPQGFAGQLKGCDCLVTSDSRKVLQKVIEPIASLEVVDERLSRYTSADEDGCTAQDVGVHFNNG